ncbi:MAG TPA: hypothetical protein VGH05_20845 [Buttiauxella sp.]|jgi:hypothetical protein
MNSSDSPHYSLTTSWQYERLTRRLDLIEQRLHLIEDRLDQAGRRIEQHLINSITTAGG